MKKEHYYCNKCKRNHYKGSKVYNNHKLSPNSPKNEIRRLRKIKITKTYRYKKYNGKSYWLHEYEDRTDPNDVFEGEIATLDQVGKVSREQSIKKELKELEQKRW